MFVCTVIQEPSTDVFVKIVVSLGLQPNLFGYGC